MVFINIFSMCSITLKYVNVTTRAAWYVLLQHQQTLRLLMFVISFQVSDPACEIAN